MVRFIRIHFQGGYLSCIVRYVEGPVWNQICVLQEIGFSFPQIPTNEMDSILLKVKVQERHNCFERGGSSSSLQVCHPIGLQ